MSELLEFFAPCPRGCEALVAEEFRALALSRVRPLTGGVTFFGSVADGLRGLMWTRVASRLLLTLARVPAENADALYTAVAELPWEDHVRAGGTIAVDASGMNAELRNTQFTAVRVKDAIADRFVSRFGRRPSVDTSDPDLRVNVVVRAERATVSIDLSGTALHRRGYREPGVQVEAPIKENLAAAVLLLAGWPEIARSGGALVDPMCGSGTFAIEGALMAGGIAPGLARRRWGVERWLGNDAGAWRSIVEDAENRREAGLASLPPIEASDHDPRAVDLSRSCVRRAGLDGHVHVTRREVSALRLPQTTEPTHGGLVVSNPPYGERLQAKAGLPALYRELAGVLDEGFAGWTLALITPDPRVSDELRMTPRRTAELFNGKIRSLVSVYDVGQRQAGEPADVRSQAPPCEAAEAFANRLAKMARHYEKWARRSGVSCYRVYDADLPDYAVAIDLYLGAEEDLGKRWVHVAEYAAPGGVDPARAEARLVDVLAIVPEVLGVPADDVFLKRRERQRGSAQYERVSRRSVVATVEEGGLLFEVNLSDYLDTGLFLDHRLTRSWLREISAGKRFLNLFAYTGSASVYAAAGGATATTSIDLSATYAEWAARNLARNGFAGERHRVIRADVLEWVGAARRGSERYDLVFCDPPTFSNSKRMQATWDVQRDHPALIRAIGDLLAPEGVLVFSCNRRKFAFAAEELAADGLVCEDVTARTIPKDFERKPGVHAVWTVRKRGSR